MSDDFESAPEASSTDTSFESLVSTELGPPPEPAKPESASPTSELTPTPSATVQQPSVSAPTAEEPSYTYNGIVFKPSDLQKDPDLMRALVTTANQGPHFKGLYENLLDEVRGANRPPQQPPQQTGPMPGQLPPPFKRPEEAVTYYQDQMKQLTDAGWIESDLVEFSPKGVAFVMQLRDQVTDARMALMNVLQMAQGYVQQNNGRQLAEEMDTLIGGLSSRGGFYADLSDKKKVEGFRNWAVGTGALVGKLRDPEFLAQLFVAYNSNNIAQVAATAAKTEQDQRAEIARKRRMAQGLGSGGARPAGSAPEPAQPWDAVVNDALSGR